MEAVFQAAKAAFAPHNIEIQWQMPNRYSIHAHGGLVGMGLITVEPEDVNLDAFVRDWVIKASKRTRA